MQDQPPELIYVPMQELYEEAYLSAYQHETILYQTGFVTYVEYASAMIRSSYIDDFYRSVSQPWKLGMHLKKLSSRLESNWITKFDGNRSQDYLDDKPDHRGFCSVFVFNRLGLGRVPLVAQSESSRQPTEQSMKLSLSDSLQCKGASQSSEA